MCKSMLFPHISLMLLIWFPVFLCSSNDKDNSALQTQVHPQRKYTFVDWVCNQVINPVTCMRGEQAQGKTYAPSEPIEISVSVTQPTPQLESRSHPNESTGFLEVPPCREKSASDSNLAAEPKPETWKWMGLKAALKVKSADLNMFAPQSM